ncbi:MAG: hypothetical protein GXP55_01000 [Deltaproteobacteria bacterium]|nr:hypothetical protein [Deltaproteobacteria bacterium]
MKPLLSLLLALACPLVAHAQGRDWDNAESNLSTDTSSDGRDPGALDPDADPESTEEGGESEDDSLFDTGDPEGGGQLALWAELAFFAGGVERAGGQTDTFATSPLIGAAYSLTSRARISAQWGFSLASHDGITVGGIETTPSDSTLRLGNPLISVDLLGHRDSLRYRVGAGLALPVASSDSATQDLAIGLAMAMRGGFHPWLWMPNRLSLIATGRVEGDLGENIVIGGDGAAALLIGTGDGANTNLSIEAGADGEYHAKGPLFVGLRLTMVLYADLAPSTSSLDNDNLQFALMPYARFLFGRSFVTAGLEINLDTPFGPSFSDAGVWGLRVGAGTVL